MSWPASTSVPQSRHSIHQRRERAYQRSWSGHRPIYSIISSSGCLSFPCHRHARLEETDHERKSQYGQPTHRDARDALVVDQHLVIPVPLLAHRLTVRQQQDDIVQKLVSLLDLARLREHLQSALTRRTLARRESTPHTLWMEVPIGFSMPTSIRRVIARCSGHPVDMEPARAPNPPSASPMIPTSHEYF